MLFVSLFSGKVFPGVLQAKHLTTVVVATEVESDFLVLSFGKES